MTKMDLLLVIDNSLSMGEKQALLAQSTPYLLRRLTRPNCSESDGTPTGVFADEDGTCSAGEPEVAPIADLHIGVITSSLGDHGSNDVCADSETSEPELDDRARLLPTVRDGLMTPGNTGFLSWDPSLPDVDALASAAAAEITAAGEKGCGYEAPLEAWYRFLVDPAPVGLMGNDGQVSVRGNVSEIVLEQRAAFLRPDSVLAIVLLSDENDCSILDEDERQGWLVGFQGGVGSNNWRMARGSSACEANPNDPCCHPCQSTAPSGCPANDTDSACLIGTSLSLEEDSMNLRCFAQKRRFGIDLLYPTSRYVEALTSRIIRPRSDGLQAQNVLFAPVNSGMVPRRPEHVVFTAIVGVPWQDAATEDSWSGESLTYLAPYELDRQKRWEVMLGDPGTNVAPSDPFMIESVEPRAKAHPLLPGVSAGTDNPINGHELAEATDELQYACTFPLAAPVPCTEDNATTCDCNVEDSGTDRPTCEWPTDGADGVQTHGKAYPGLRQLEVARALGNSGVVASICAKSTSADDPLNDESFAYNPAMAAFVGQLPAAFSGPCLGVPLTTAESDPTHLACQVVEVLFDTMDRPVCDCSTFGLESALPGVRARAMDYLRNQQWCGDNRPLTPCDEYCVCRIPELSGTALEDCQNDPAYEGSEIGFCYIDPAQGAGSLDTLVGCSPGYKRLIRFSGGAPTLGAAFVDCAPEDQAP
jgi:hypothetical protein